MAEIRRGSAAIQEAAKPSEGSNFRPYLKSIYWDEDGEEHYILLLNDVEDIPLFEMITFIKDANGHVQETVAKTDPFFGEKHDGFVDTWDATARKKNIAIAVELKPIIEVVKTGKRTLRKPRAFEVETVEYERRVYDDEGKATGETEEVVAPAIGYITQSPFNFFNQLSNYDANEAPVTETALKVTRIAKDMTTTYQFVGYPEIPIDLTNLVEHIDGVSYLNDEMDDLIESIADLEPEEAALFIGKTLLDKREEELIDDDRYQELLEGVTESMDKFGNKGKKKKKEKAKPTSRVAQRKAKADVEPEDEPGESNDSEATDEVTPKRKTKKAASAKQTPQSRMAELREKAAAKKAEAAANDSE